MQKIAGVVLTLAIALAPFRARAEETRPHVDRSGVNMQPAYPASARQNKERGTVVLQVGVTQDGAVNQIRLLQTSGFDDLDAAAIAGVMGWHFVPARSDGLPVAGSANLAIAFQPPDTDPAGGETPRPKSDFLPPVLHVEAERGFAHAENYSVPCETGRLEATIEFLHPAGPAGLGWAPAASMSVRTGKQHQSGTEWMTLFMVGQQFIIPPQERFEFTAGNGANVGTRLAYSHSTTLGEQETVWISWNATGLVTGTVGAMQSHQVQFAKAPTEFGLAMSGGAVNFHNPALFCYPANSPNATE